MNTSKQHFGGIINSEPMSMFDQKQIFEEKLLSYMGRVHGLGAWVGNIKLYEVDRAFQTLKWNKAA